MILDAVNKYHKYNMIYTFLHGIAITDKMCL